MKKTIHFTEMELSQILIDHLVGVGELPNGGGPWRTMVHATIKKSKIEGFGFEVEPIKKPAPVVKLVKS